MVWTAEIAHGCFEHIVCYANRRTKNVIIHQAWIVYPHFGMQQINKQFPWGQWGKQKKQISASACPWNLDYQFQSIYMQVSTLTPWKKYSFFKPLGFSHTNSVALKKTKPPKSWTSKNNHQPFHLMAWCASLAPAAWVGWLVQWPNLHRKVGCENKIWHCL